MKEELKLIIQGIDHLLWAATTANIAGTEVGGVLNSSQKDSKFYFMNGASFALDGRKGQDGDSVTYFTTNPNYEVVVKVEIREIENEEEEKTGTN